MKLILSPIAGFEDDAPPFVDGDILHYRGVEYNLSPLGEGEEIEIGEPFEGCVTRANGVVIAKLQYKYSVVTAEPNQPTDWAAYTFNVTGGQCHCPIIRKPELQIAIEELRQVGVNYLKLQGYNDTQIAAMTTEEFLNALENHGAENINNLRKALGVLNGSN